MSEQVTIPPRWLVEDPVVIGACVRLMAAGRRGADPDAQAVSGLSRHMWGKHALTCTRLLAYERKRRADAGVAA